MERFPLGPVLDHYGVLYVDNMPGWQMIRCPVHDESHASCSVNLDARFFDCKACGARGGALDIIKALEGLEGEAAREFAVQLCGEQPREQQRGYSARRVADSGFRPRFKRANGAQRGWREGVH